MDLVKNFKKNFDNSIYENIFDVNYESKIKLPLVYESDIPFIEELVNEVFKDNNIPQRYKIIFKDDESDELIIYCNLDIKDNLIKALKKEGIYGEPITEFDEEVSEVEKDDLIKAKDIKTDKDGEIKLDKDTTMIIEDGEGGCDAGGSVGMTTADVAGYDAPFEIPTEYTKKQKKMMRRGQLESKKVVKESDMEQIGNKNLNVEIEFLKDKSAIKFWLDYMNIENYEIDDNGIVNVNGDVYVHDDNRNHKSLPVQFGIVTGNFSCPKTYYTTLKGCPKEVGGNFSCHWSYNLTTLEGAPEKIGGEFDCSSCFKLTTLKGSPKYVGDTFVCRFCDKLKTLEGSPEYVPGGFYCNNCGIESLYGSPKEVGVAFYCSNNKLTTLEGGPRKVGMYYNCCENRLTTLKGAPQKVGGEFSCWKNQLESLYGSPKEVGGDFTCFDNKLISLEGSPIYVGGEFRCCDNKLITLKGAPQKVGGDFICVNNKLISLEGSPIYVGGEFRCTRNEQLTSLKGIGEVKKGIESDFFVGELSKYYKDNKMNESKYRKSIKEAVQIPSTAKRKGQNLIKGIEELYRISETKPNDWLQMYDENDWSFYIKDYKFNDKNMTFTWKERNGSLRADNNVSNQKEKFVANGEFDFYGEYNDFVNYWNKLVRKTKKYLEMDSTELDRKLGYDVDDEIDESKKIVKESMEDYEQLENEILDAYRNLDEEDLSYVQQIKELCEKAVKLYDNLEPTDEESKIIWDEIDPSGYSSYEERLVDMIIAIDILLSLRKGTFKNSKTIKEFKSINESMEETLFDSFKEFVGENTFTIKDVKNYIRDLVESPDDEVMDDMAKETVEDWENYGLVKKNGMNYKFL